MVKSPAAEPARTAPANTRSYARPCLPLSTFWASRMVWAWSTFSPGLEQEEGQGRRRDD